MCITLGTGVGGGIIIDGRIYGGFNFAGAELGHIVINEGGELCGCGYTGLLGGICLRHGSDQSDPSRHGESPRQQNVGDRLRSRQGGWAHRLRRHAGRGCRGFQVVDTYIQHIACGLVNVINIFQPEVLCIGGGICKEGGIPCSSLCRHIIERERYSKYSTHQTRLCVAKLGNDAGIIGAACLGK